MIMQVTDPHASRRYARLLPALCALSLMIGMLGSSGPAVALDQQVSPGLGRLFLTPEQRRELDASRPAHSAPGAPDAGLRLPAASHVILTGVLKRSGGPDVVWINGHQARAGDDKAPVQVRRGPDSHNVVTLVAPADGRSVKLKPGQRWTP
jgi:hypothetical protein